MVPGPRRRICRLCHCAVRASGDRDPNPRATEKCRLGGTVPTDLEHAFVPGPTSSVSCEGLESHVASLSARLLATGGMAVAFSMAAAETASAADCHTSRYEVGSDYMYVGSTRSHYAQIAWNEGTRHLKAQMDSGWLNGTDCADTWFDWATYSGHYDIRLARTCRSYSNAAADGLDGFTETYYSERNLLGIQKAAGCIYSGGSVKECVQAPKATAGCTVSDSTIAEDVPNYSARAWVRNANDTVSYFSGGYPPSSTS